MKGDNPLNRMASFCNAFFRLKPFNDLHAWITMAHWTEVWNTCKSTSKFFLSISLLWHFQSNKVWFSEGLTIKTALKFTRALKYSYMLTEHASLYAQSQRIEFDFQSEWLKSVFEIQFHKVAEVLVHAEWTCLLRLWEIFHTRLVMLCL